MGTDVPPGDSHTRAQCQGRVRLSREQRPLSQTNPRWSQLPRDCGDQELSDPGAFSRNLLLPLAVSRSLPRAQPAKLRPSLGRPRQPGASPSRVTHAVPGPGPGVAPGDTTLSPWGGAGLRGGRGAPQTPWLTHGHLQGSWGTELCSPSPSLSQPVPFPGYTPAHPTALRGRHVPAAHTSHRSGAKDPPAAWAGIVILEPAG